jgi:hypothetical protein
MLRSADLNFGGAKPKIRDIVSKRVAVVKPAEGKQKYPIIAIVATSEYLS